MGLAVKYGYRVLFLLTVLLSGCDIFNTPIRPFIDGQFGDLTVGITGTPRVGQTLTAAPSDPYVSYRWQRSDSSSGPFTPVTGATGSTYLLKGADLGKYFNVTITNANGGDITSAATGEVKYGIVVPSPDLTVKFGMRTFEPLTPDMVTGAFTILHQLISSPVGGDDFTAIIELGDYIDLPSLTIDGDTITDQAITVSGADKGRLLRLIVVGINSFKADSPYTGVPGAPDHVVFQFQNVPVTHDMNPLPNSNAGGYAGSNMKDYLMDDFLPGLETATGLTNAMLWVPARKVANGGDINETGEDTVTDTLWLPTVWEMFGNNASFSSTTYETSTNQARLEYYTDDTRRTKYSSTSTGSQYWLASPYYDDSVGFCEIGANGIVNGAFASLEYGCVPAFCVQ